MITIPTFDSYFLAYILLCFRPDVNVFRVVDRRNGGYQADVTYLSPFRNAVQALTAWSFGAFPRVSPIAS